MSIKALGKLAAGLLLGGMLTGCIDVTIDVDVISATDARATMTQTMGAEFYSMIKLSAEQAEKAGTPVEDEFCADGAPTENEDGTATCTLVEEDSFAALTMGSEEEAVVFAPAGPGLVRVSVSLAKMKAEMHADELDEESQQMLEAFFAGRSIKLRFSGTEVTDTNMVLAEDKSYAEQSVAFLDLIRGKPDLPDEFYAVVRAP